MLTNTKILSLFKYHHLGCFRNASFYIKQKDIDQISKNYKEGTWETMKKYAAIFKHIGIQGLKQLKKDGQMFVQLNRKQNLTQQQTKHKMRIYNDIFKMGPLWIIQILPFSGPLFMLYMYTYPGSIPSWFMIDYYHDRHEQLKIRNQTKNLKYFKQKGLKPEDINLDTMSLRQLRKLTLLLFGIYRDGTIGYRKLFNKKIQYFLFESYSRFLIKRNLVKRFKRDLTSNKITNKMGSLQEMVKWKYERIMNGQYLFEYKPMYEHTVQKMKANGGEQSQIFNQIQKEGQSISQASKSHNETVNKRKQNNTNIKQSSPVEGVKQKKEGPKP